MRLRLVLLLCLCPLLSSRALQVVINEFVTSNHTGITDEDGQTSDWIELHNLTDAPLPLAGWHLTDHADLPAKWTLPAVELPARGFLLVFASGKDRTPTNGNLHANFSLNTDGEYLALVRPDLSVEHDFGSKYPDQLADTSFGLAPDFLTLDDTRFYKPPSPGATNSVDDIEWLGRVPPVEANPPRGIYTNAVAVSLSCAAPFATIIYTLDGSLPSATNGVAYATPIPLSRSDVLSTTAILPGYLPATVRTHTYVFPSEAAFQTVDDTLAAGFPPTWKGLLADYGMDPDVVGPGDLFGGRYAATIAADLQTIPSVSLTLPVDDLFGTSGIYSNPLMSGPTWERACAFEFLDPSGTGLVFQVRAGVQLMGGASRNFGNARKKSFRLVFKEKYGGKRLVAPLFGPGAANSFDTVTLRMEANDGYSFGILNEAQYARDTFVRELHRRMGHTAIRSRPVHLYLNGIYWGVYNLAERPDDEFASDYLGGRAADWDVISSGSPPTAANVINGDGDPVRVARTLGHWTNLVVATEAVRDAPDEAARTAALFALQGLDATGNRDPMLPVHLDLDGYIDYMLLNYWVGNRDWPWQNFYAARLSTSNSTGWTFFSWDAEWVLGSVNTTNLNKLAENTGCAVPFQNLRASAEFRLRFADRAQRHLKPGGVLHVDPLHPVYDSAHPERNPPAHLYAQVSAPYERPLVGESARWGDQSVATPHTVDIQWRNGRYALTNSYFAVRGPLVTSQFLAAGLLSPLAAPVPSPAGGGYVYGQTVQLAAPTGTIYYTINGEDPRLSGGGVHPGALIATGPILLVNQVVLRARALDGQVWSALLEETYVPDLRVVLHRPGGGFRLEWNPIQNLPHVVQTSPSLLNPVWTPLGTVSTNGLGALVLPELPSQEGRVFRVLR